MRVTEHRSYVSLPATKIRRRLRNISGGKLFKFLGIWALVISALSTLSLVAIMVIKSSFNLHIIALDQIMSILTFIAIILVAVVLCYPIVYAIYAFISFLRGINTAQYKNQKTQKSVATIDMEQETPQHLESSIHRLKLSAIINVLLPTAIAFVLLMIATGYNPYGYYIFLRFAITGIAAYLTYRAYIIDEHEEGGMFLAFAWIAVLYNPIIPFGFSKEGWNNIDVWVALYILVCGIILSYKTYKAR